MPRQNMFTPDPMHIAAVKHLCDTRGGKDLVLPQLAQSSLYGDHLVQNGSALELRADSADASTATPYSRDELTQKLKRVIKTRRRKRKGKQLFRVNRELQPGMLSYRVYRVKSTGKPRLLSQGGMANDLTQVSVSLEHVDQPIEYYGLMVTDSWLDKLRSGNVTPTVINARAEKFANAREDMQDYADKRIFKRQDGQQSYTMLDNPWFARLYPTTIITHGMNGKALYALFLKIINTPVDLELVEDEDGPSDLFAPDRIIGVLKQTPFDEDPKYTVHQAILDNTSIEEIHSVNAFANANGSNKDAIMATNPLDFSIEECMPPTPLPPEITSMADKTVIIGADGGVACEFAGSTCLAFAEFQRPTV